MPLQMNGNALKGVFFNGQKVKTVRYNGEVVYQAELVLFANGSQNESVTGGWKFIDGQTVAGYTPGSNLDVYLQNTSSDAMWITNNVLDLSEYETLTADITAQPVGGVVYLCVYEQSVNNVWVPVLKLANPQNGKFKMDISDVKSGAIAVRLYGNGITTGPAIFNNVKLE